MEDLFQREQQILDGARSSLVECRKGSPLDIEQYALLIKEYERLLKLSRRFTKLSDRTTVSLNMDKLDLLDQVRYDLLTGVYSRRFMEEKLEKINTLLGKSGGNLSVLMIDIDYFKKYNDTYGHQAGDDCLQTVAKALRSSIRKSGDFVARYGGEEFIVVSQDTDQQSARSIAEKLLKNVQDCCIPHKNSTVKDCITISIGFTSGPVKHTRMVQEFIKRADEALYHSKNSGRNQYTFMNLEGDIV